MTRILIPFAALAITQAHFIPVTDRDASSSINHLDSDAEEFSFAILTDSQLGKFAKKTKHPEQLWYMDTQLLNAAITQLNHYKNLKFVAHLGDIVQAHPNYTDKADPETNAAQAASALAGFNLSDFPVFTVPGNRDLGDEWNAPLDNPSAVIDDYTQQWGDDYFSFRVGNVQFIALDTQIWKDEDPDVAPYFEAEFEWFEDQMATAVNDASVENIIIFMHIPPYWQTPEEEVEDRNLAFVNLAVNSTGIDGTCRERFLQALPTTKPYWVNAGHLHVDRDLSDGPYNIQINSAITMTKEDGNPNNPWRTGLGGVRLVNVKQGVVSHQWLYMEEIAQHYQ